MPLRAFSDSVSALVGVASSKPCSVQQQQQREQPKPQLSAYTAYRETPGRTTKPKSCQAPTCTGVKASVLLSPLVAVPAAMRRLRYFFSCLAFSLT